MFVYFVLYVCVVDEGGVECECVCVYDGCGVL